METTAVTVITPCFNMGNYLGRAIESVRTQSSQDYEMIVVDDGSSDCTGDLMRAYAQNAQISYVRVPNGGLPKARNIGLALAQGHFVQFLDADDFLHEDKLRTEIGLLERHPTWDAVHSDFLCVDESGLNPLSKYASPTPVLGNFLSDLILRWERGFSIPIHCFLIRRDALRGLTFDETLANHEDWDLYIRLASAGFASWYHDDVMAYYRLRPSSMSHQISAMEEGKQAVLDRAMRLSDDAHRYVLIRRALDSERSVR